MDASPTDVISLNRALIENLKGMGYIQTSNVEDAFRAIPRHFFISGVPLDQVYQDKVFVTKEIDGKPASSCEQPAIVAIMLEQLGLQAGQRVLEIGAGTGHTAGLVAHIVGTTGKVITMDIEPELVSTAREHLVSAGLDRVQVVCADGWAGYPAEAPYDRILLTVASWDLAPAWLEQLRPTGRIVLPLDLKFGLQKSMALERVGDHLESVSVRDCGFMRLRGDSAYWPSGSGSHVELAPGLDLWSAEDRELNRAEIYSLVTGRFQEFPTGVRVTLGDFWKGLRFWRALMYTDNCVLRATDEAVDRDSIPSVIRHADSRQNSNGTGGLLGNTSLAVWSFGSANVPLMEESEGMSPLDVYVRLYGSDETCARRLIEQIQTWDAEGRPAESGLRVKVFPIDDDYAPSASEILIKKRWTQLVLDWP